MTRDLAGLSVLMVQYPVVGSASRRGSGSHSAFRNPCHFVVEPLLGVQVNI